MKLLEFRLLRGPNIYARQPCMKAIIDLEELKGISSTDLPGFAQRLCALLPTIGRHRCSPGVPGGFEQRLLHGTYMAHIVEHVALELQCLAGSNAGFGRTRAVRGRAGCYTVVCAYRIEALILPAFETAMKIVTAIARAEPMSLASLLEPLKSLVSRHGVGPSTQAILDAAQWLGIPHMRLSNELSLYQLGFGARQQRIQATVTGQTSHIAVGIASDKQLTRQLLEQAGLPVPKGVVVSNVESALRAASRLRGPVVVKPVNANHGKGVSTNLGRPQEVEQAYEQARRFSSRVIVEEFIEGKDYRVLVLAGKVAAAARREPPSVLGDGKSTILSLISDLNLDPRRGKGHTKALTRVSADPHMIERLKRKGLTLQSVPLVDERVVLRDNANLSTGGSAVDVTAQMHPDTIKACERAARYVGLDVAGVDLVCRDITSSLAEQGAIVEVNAAPGLRMHEHPSDGAHKAVGRALVQALFPAKDSGRIPVLAVTGTNGKTTTAALISHVFQLEGECTGLASTDGIFIGGQRIRSGDCAGYWSARTVLRDPEVEVAILETARGGILKRGLGFDYCDVAIILNVSADHLGLDGVDTVRQMAQVKGVVARSARHAVVLNADDPLCVDMASGLRPNVEVVYFALTEQNPVVQTHLSQGGRCVLLVGGHVMACHLDKRQRLLHIDELAVTLQGRARHNVSNVLAAVAALVAQGGCSPSTITKGIESFTCSTEKNPLRMNVFHIQGVTVILDYAHNLDAYRSVLATSHALQCRRIVGVITAPGDRLTKHLAQIAAVCARELDEIVVYEVTENRGRKAGEVMEILRHSALVAASPSTPVHAVRGAQQAVLFGFERCAPGDLLLVGGATSLSDLDLIMERAKA